MPFPRSGVSRLARGVPRNGTLQLVSGFLALLVDARLTKVSGGDHQLDEGYWKLYKEDIAEAKARAEAEADAEARAKAEEANPELARIRRGIEEELRKAREFQALLDARH